MLHCRICRGNNRRFRFKIFSGQGFFSGKNYSSASGYAGYKFPNRIDKKFSRIKILVIIIFFVIAKILISDFIYVEAKTDQENNIAEAINKVIETLDLSAFEKVLTELDLLKGESLGAKITKLIGGDAREEFADLGEYVKKNIYSEISILIPSLAGLLIVIILLSVVEAVKSARIKENIATVCTYIGNIVIAGIIISLFTGVYLQARNVTKQLTNVIELLFPVVLTLLTASGGTASAAIFQPSVSFLCNGISVVYAKLLFPIILFMLCFSAINAFSPIIKTDRMSDFLKSLFKWIVGLSSVFFCFFVSAQGISASNYDNVSLRALKYAMGNSVPLINGLISGGFDVVVASCVLIKNALGSFSLIAIVYIVALPLLKTIFLSLALRFIAGVSQSIASDSSIKFIGATADVTTYLATALSATAIIYIITVLIAMCSMGAKI